MATYAVIQPHRLTYNGQVIFKASPGKEESFFLEAYRFFKADYPKFHKMDLFCQLGFLSAWPIVPDHRLMAPEKTGVLLASKSGSSYIDQNYYEKVFTQANISYSPAQFTYTLPSAILGELSIKHNFQGENYFFLQASEHLDLLRDYAKSLFKSNRLEACLLGWMDYYDEAHFQSCYVWIEAEDLKDLDNIIFNINKNRLDYGKAPIN